MEHRFSLVFFGGGYEKNQYTPSTAILLDTYAVCGVLQGLQRLCVVEGGIHRCGVYCKCHLAKIPKGRRIPVHADLGDLRHRHIVLQKGLKSTIGGSACKDVTMPVHIFTFIYVKT